MKFGDIVKNMDAEGKEKHAPVIEIGKDKGESSVDVVHVVVGKETPHPNTVEHYIAWIELYGVKENGQVINLGRANFAPSYTNSNVRFHRVLTSASTSC